MTPQEIFLRASEIEDASERAAYLDTACGDDVDLRAKVDSLLTTLESYESNDGTDVGDDATVDRSNVATAGGQVGKMIGAYKLLQQIGEGGFGVVYMAEQVEPIRRKVALKIVKPGMDTKDVIARFEAERQALALMDHPNIAKVLDGGVTEFGRPYFVMELVKGVPITEFCDKNKLSTQQRIDLFLTVCRAIDHAHGKGIIHRDIKPSNVMVTLHDGKPVCKVIDFGVSKALSQQLTEKTLFTAYGQMIGTPTYMSPEQAEMSGLDIDTRSDVYSLGVVLYELLTGTTPLGKQEIQSATYDELQRMIKEEEAQRPSTRVSTLGKKATINAKNRSTEERKLSQQLRGDIDWIVIKALEKDRNRRYDSAKAMAEDLERHAKQEPVLARPPSLIYRAQKFLRRNRIKVGVFATVSVLALVVLSSGVVLFESREEQTKLQEQADELAQEKAALETQVSSIEEARRLLREDVPKLKKDFKNATLYQLLVQIKPLLEEDADYIAAFDEHFRQVTVGNHQDMPLKIEIQNWDRDGADWVEVPFDYDTKTAVVPRTRHRQRITVDETVIVERTMLRLQEFMGIPDFVDDAPDGMVYVNRTGPRNRVTFVEIEPFYCDQYEVSNAEFKEFVDAGGYGEPVFWKTAFSEISDEEADNLRDSFVDSTGKPGPGHWVHGSFPEGLGNHPVHSVSWYEAMAYAEFRGKALPTSFHWRWATHAADELVVPHSNFDGEGAKPRGANEGIGYRPIFDAAGNVNEWTLNGFENSQNKCCCGASWDDPHYLFRARQAMSPSTRSDEIGFRCIRVIESYDERLNSPVSPRVFNIVEEGAVTPELFDVYKSMYAYDRNGDLSIELLTDDLRPSDEEYREEQVHVRTAYGNERLAISLLFPRKQQEKYQPIVFVPGADAQRIGTYDSKSNGAGGRFIREIVKSGRVVVIANYQGMFDRNEIPKSGENARRDWYIQLTKDVSRVVDYLETREDIAVEKISYMGTSMGAFMGVFPLATDSRFQAGVLVVGGAIGGTVRNEINPTALAPFIKGPVLMLNGEFDNVFPLDSSVQPLFERVGSDDKELKLYPSAHGIDMKLWVPYANQWLDERLGQP